MLSKFFEYQVKNNLLDKRISHLIEELQNKKIVIYGAGNGFLEINKKYNLTTKLDIIYISDKKFEKQEINTFEGIKTLKPHEIKDKEFDYILITNEYSKQILDFLSEEGILKDKIKLVFKETIFDEVKNYNYIAEFNFEKHLKYLEKKLKNKTIMLYGAGAFIETIKKYYDLSNLNIIGISDMRFGNSNK